MEGIQLFPAIKKKREKDAICLVEGGFDVTATDESQSTPLHLACDQDMVDLIVSILKKDRNVLELVDGQGRTALHRAVESGKRNALVALVTFEANLNPLDADNMSPLETAIRNKDQDIVDLLCYFGCAVVLDDWVIATMDEDYLLSLGEKDYNIMNMVIQQNERLINIEYESIVNPVYYIETDKERNYFSEVDIKLELNNGMPNFFLSISKESKDVTGGMNENLDNVKHFSDVYEVRAWGNVPDTIKFTLKIKGSLRCNEQLYIEPIDGEVKGKEITEKSQNTAEVKEESMYMSMDVNLKTDARFFIGVKEKIETFDVGSHSQNIKLEMEPNAEVSIPKGAFTGGGKLNINVSETKEWNYEDIEDSNMYLFTNAMDLTMTNGQQPGQAVTLKLPIHTPVEKGDGVIILAAGDDFENDDDWEVLNLKSKTSDHVVVDASHFSVYVATNNRDVKKSKQLATQACKKEHRVECFAMTKIDSAGKYLIVVEIALKRKGKNRRRHWRRKGFDSHAVAYHDSVMKENTKYTIKFSGNIESEVRKESLTFKTLGKAKCYRTFHLNNTSDSPLKGKVKIGKNVRQENNPNSTNDQPDHLVAVKPSRRVRNCFSCLCTTTQPKQPLPRRKHGQVALKFEKMVSLAIDTDTTTAYTVSEAKVDPSDPQCTIPVLRWNSLKRLTGRLSEGECLALVRFMRLNEQVISTLQSEKAFRKNWYRKWRLARPNENQVKHLVDALRHIQKDDEADDVEDGFRYNEEYMEV